MNTYTVHEVLVRYSKTLRWIDLRETVIPYDFVRPVQHELRCHHVTHGLDGSADHAVEHSVLFWMLPRLNPLCNLCIQLGRGAAAVRVRAAVPRGPNGRRPRRSPVCSGR